MESLVYVFSGTCLIGSLVVHTRDAHAMQMCLMSVICCLLQEITLQKSSSQEQLGLTVSYIHCAAGSGGSVCGGGNNSGGNNSVKSINEVDSEASTEVYISNILPDSLAARDGRLRQGDQILQVSVLDSCFFF